MKNGIKTLAVWLVIGIIFIVVLNSVFNNPNTKMSYSELMNKISLGEVSEINISSDKTVAYVTMKDAENSTSNSNTIRNLEKEVVIPSIDTFMEQISDNLAAGQLTLNQEEESILLTVFSAFSPFVILIIFLLFWILLMNPNQSGNKSMSFGKSKARILNTNDSKTKVTFKETD